MNAPNIDASPTWPRVCAAMRRAALSLVPPHETDGERAEARAQAHRFEEGAADSLRRAALLYAQAGDLDAAKRARAALDALA